MRKNCKRGDGDCAWRTVTPAGVGCGLNGVPLISAMCLPLLRRHFVDLLWSTGNWFPTLNWFACAGALLPVLTETCVFQPSFCTTCELFLCALGK